MNMSRNKASAESSDRDPKFHCPICNRNLASLSGYLKHLKKHEPPGGFICRYCEDRFCTEADLKHHCDEKHTIIACRICKGTTFAKEDEYREHIRTVHNGIDREIYKCEKCGAAYKTLDPFRRHQQTQCGTIKPFKCDQCEMSFVTKYNLKQHKELHTGESKFCCSYCGKNFLQKGRLIEHERSHTGEKPYKCDVCGKCFAHRESIVTHSSLHTGIRLVECKCCHSRFSCYSNLIKHRRNRPDTCGQPQYDPPKNRVRAHISRIPPTLNPTSEIKVNNVNKIIKPLELPPKVQSEINTAPKRRASQESHDSVHANSAQDWQSEDMTVTPTLEAANFAWCDEAQRASSDAVDVPLKLETVDVPVAEQSDFEAAAAVSVGDIFKDKDSLLDCLLGGDEDQCAGGSLSDFNRSDKDKLKPDHDNKEVILNEPEIILLNGDVDVGDAEHDEELEQEEDILNVENASMSSIMDAVSDAKCAQGEAMEGHGEVQEHGVRCTRRRAMSSGNRSKTVRAQLRALQKNEMNMSCPYCVKIYHMRKPFEKHLREDHQRGADEIKEMLSTETAASNDQVFQCPVCDKTYLVRKRLQAHVALHGPNGALKFKCPCYCNVYFASKEEATAHAQKEHRDLLYCNICEKFMTAHDNLKNHMKSHHADKAGRSQVRNLVCDKCGKKFSGRTPLTDHVRSDCGRVPLYPCTVCGKRLTTAGILKTHMLLHKDDTPFQCDKCGKTFKVKAQYKMHIKTRHTDYKPFKCHLCPKEYPYRESLLTHMTVHTGIKRFLCDGCGKRFTCISNLQAHRKVQADTCGALPLNAKATQYMGVQKGNLLLGSKPEAGFDYQETNTLVAREIMKEPPKSLS